MWITVLMMAIAMSMEPFRIGMTVLMLNRPRPMLQLLAFLCGGFAMGTGVGLVVLFVLRPRLLGSTHFTLPTVQIVVGVVALLIAGLLTTKVLAGRFQRPCPPAAPGNWGLSMRARQLLNGRSVWVAGAIGLGTALPSVDYLAALAAIVASAVTPAMQVGALLMFNVVAFALVEIPLVAHLVAPDSTRALMAALHDWIRSRPRPAVAALLAGVGCVLVVVGIAGL